MIKLEGQMQKSGGDRVITKISEEHELRLQQLLEFVEGIAASNIDSILKASAEPYHVNSHV